MFFHGALVWPPGRTCSGWSPALKRRLRRRLVRSWAFQPWLPWWQNPHRLVRRCFGYPYIYPYQYWYRRCFFQLKDCFCVFCSWFWFWCKPQMVDSGRLVSQTQNSGCTSSCSRRWGTWLQNDGIELVPCIWDLIDVPIRYVRYVLDLKRGDLDRCHNFTSVS